MAEKSEKAEVPGPATMSRRQRLDMLRQQLEQERSAWLGDWRELNDFLMPRRGRFSLSTNGRTPRSSNKIIDSAASFALRTLASGMMSGITSPARPWFRLTTPDPDLAEFPSVKQWLHIVTQRLLANFAKSNWYKVLPMVYKDMGGFGTAAMAMMEDDETVFRCKDFSIGSYAIANDSKGRVRTFSREFTMTALQLMEKFGRENLTDQTRMLIDQGQGQQGVKVAHIVHQNADYDPSKLESKRKRFYSCYYELSAPANADKFLEESGFDEFPILAPRWEVSGEDVYGSDCPGMMAIGDVKQLQTMKKRMLQGIEKQVNPPMVGPPELQFQRASTIAGDITYIAERDGTKGFRPAHEVRLNLADLRNEQNEVRHLIRRAFFEDIILMIAMMDETTGSTQPRTAAEIDVRQQEKLLVFGPMLEQLNEDLLNPAVDRNFAISLRNGDLPPAPPELEGMALKVDYISIMHSAQKSAGIDRIERFSGFIQGLATMDPTVLDKVNRDQIVDEYSEMLSLPPRIVVPDEQVAAVRQARARAQQAKEAAEVAAAGASAAKDLSETDTRGENALTDLMAGMGAGIGGV